MLTPLQWIAAMTTQKPIDEDVGRRRAVRYRVHAPGSYRTGSGTAQSVELFNISELGCQFLDRTRRLSAGTQLSVRIGNLGPFDARVAWVDGANIGLRFNTPLYAPYLKQILDALPEHHRQFERRISIRAIR
jgi:hypothetical protein